MDYSQYGYPGSYANNYAQQQQQQQQYPGSFAPSYIQQQQQLHPPPGAPYIRNPFVSEPGTAAAAGAVPDVDAEYEAQVAQWSSAYTGDGDKDKKKGVAGARGNTTKTTENGQQATVIRKGGGTEWEDNTLLDWDPTHFRIMVGNLAGEVTDDSLAKAFAPYGMSKARVVRDKRTTKSKGYGFVSFSDGELGFKAAREMVGKYIGSHPVTIQRSKTDIRPSALKKKYEKKSSKNRDKDKKDDPLRANTGASIAKKPARNAGYKLIG